MKRWYDNWDAITPIFKFSPDVGKVIYTTNAIESLNSTYRKLNRQRSVFPSDTTLLKALYLATFEATKNGLWALETGDGSTVNSALCMRDDSQNNRIYMHDEKDIFDVCSWHARNHVVYIARAGSSNLTPPILLADRIGIFIFVCSSSKSFSLYRERQATLQSSYQRTSTMLISQWKSKWSHKPSSALSKHPQTLNALSWVLSLKSTLT